jgi:hypothetical protein
MIGMRDLGCMAIGRERWISPCPYGSRFAGNQLSRAASRSFATALFTIPDATPSGWRTYEGSCRCSESIAAPLLAASVMLLAQLDQLLELSGK